MNIHIATVDTREKRWFGKVALAAVRTVNAHIDDLCGDVRIEVRVEFATSASQHVEVIETNSGAVRYTTFVLAAQDWTSIEDSTADATAQIAAATLAATPVNARREVAARFTDKGIAPFTVVRRTNNELGHVPTDFYLYIEQPLKADLFFKLVELIDMEYTRQSVGQVTGSAYSVRELSSCVDLAATDKVKAQRIAEEQLQVVGIRTYRFEPQQSRPA